MNVLRKILCAALAVLAAAAMSVPAFADDVPSEVYLAQDRIEPDTYYTVIRNRVVPGTPECYTIYQDSDTNTVFFNNFRFSDMEVAATVSIATDRDIMLVFEGDNLIRTDMALESLNISTMTGKAKELRADIVINGSLSIVNRGYVMDTVGISVFSPEISLYITGGPLTINMTEGELIKKRGIASENDINIRDAEITTHVTGGEISEDNFNTNTGIYANGNINIEDSRITCISRGSYRSRGIMANRGSLSVSNSSVSIFSDNWGLASDEGNIVLKSSAVRSEGKEAAIHVVDGNFRNDGGSMILSSGKSSGIELENGEMTLAGVCKISSKENFVIKATEGKINVPAGYAFPEGAELKKFNTNEGTITVPAITDPVETEGFLKVETISEMAISQEDLEGHAVSKAGPEMYFAGVVAAVIVAAIIIKRKKTA